jgi:hypothetical protein
MKIISKMRQFDDDDNDDDDDDNGKINDVMDPSLTRTEDYCLLGTR